MVRVDKCPGCAAYLPPPAFGRVRRCEYCHLVVEGATQTVDVEADDVLEAVRQRLAELRAQKVVRPPSPARPAAAKWIGLGALVAIGVVVFVSTRRGRDVAAVSSSTPTASASARTPSPPEEDPGARADREAIEAAGGYTHLDPIKYLADLSRRVDALDGYRLVSFSVPRVRPDGLADLSLGDHLSASFEFRSPARSRPPEGTHVGVEVDVPCGLRHAIGPTTPPSGPAPSTARASGCIAQLVVAPPTCTLAQVWKRALAEGAPSEGVAELAYQAGRSPRRGEPTNDVPAPGTWSFRIEGTDVSLRFSDTCDALTAGLAARTLAGAPPPEGLPGGLELEDDEEAPQELALVKRTFGPIARSLGACFARPARGHDAIFGAELLWRFDVDAAGRVRTHDGKMQAIISGFFQGRMGDIMAAMRRCATPVLARAKFPPSTSATPAPFVVRVRIGFDGELAVGKLHRGEVRDLLAPPTAPATTPTP